MVDQVHSLALRQQDTLIQQVREGLNDTADSFLAAIERGEAEVAPSSLYAAAAVLEGVAFINGSPQNTFVPGLIELAVQKGARGVRLVSAHLCVGRHLCTVLFCRLITAASFCHRVLCAKSFWKTVRMPLPQG